MTLARVHKDKRLVCVYWEGLGMYEVVKINKKGKINKNYSSRTSYATEPREAFKAMGVPYAGFKAVVGARKILDKLKKANNWEAFPEAVWEKATKFN